jgi:TonB family protein
VVPLNAVGNDRPFSIVSEIWKSPDLQIIVLNKDSNPQSGERTYKLFNISRSEPEANLFQPPADYTVEDYNAATASDSGAYPIGGDVSAPALISKVEPKYSDEARHAHLSGSVALSLVVGEDGVPRDIKVVRPLGMGLNETAMEAVSQWRFRPGMKDGVPVPVRANVQVSFRLLTKPK